MIPAQMWKLIRTPIANVLGIYFANVVSDNDGRFDVARMDINA